VALTKYNYNSFDLTTAASKGLAFNSSANGFETSVDGSMTLIKTITASNDANVDFDHGSSDVVLDSTYPVYLIKFINIHPVTDSVEFQFQGNGAGETGFNETITSSVFRTYHDEAGSGQALEYIASKDQANGTSYQSITDDVGNGNDESLAGELYLFNPSSTTFVKHFMCRTVDYNANDHVLTYHTVGYFNTTTAIDQIVFKFESGNIDSGTFKLYGIKDS